MIKEVTKIFFISFICIMSLFYNSLLAVPSTFKVANGLIVAYAGRREGTAKVCRPHAERYRFKSPQMIGLHAGFYYHRDFVRLLYIHYNKIPSSTIEKIKFAFFSAGNYGTEKKGYGEIDFADEEMQKQWDKGWIERMYDVEVPPVGLSRVWNFTVDIVLKNGDVLTKRHQLAVYDENTKVVTENGKSPWVIGTPKKASTAIYNETPTRRPLAVSHGSREDKNDLKSEAKEWGVLVAKGFADGIPEFRHVREFAKRRPAIHEIDVSTLIEPGYIGFWIEQQNFRFDFFHQYQFQKACGFLYYKKPLRRLHQQSTFSFVQTEIRLFQKTDGDKIIQKKMDDVYKESVQLSRKMEFQAKKRNNAHRLYGHQKKQNMKQKINQNIKQKEEIKSIKGDLL